jgi:hypothetical protein
MPQLRSQDQKDCAMTLKIPTIDTGDVEAIKRLVGKGYTVSCITVPLYDEAFLLLTSAMQRSHIEVKRIGKGHLVNSVLVDTLLFEATP